MTKQGDMKKEYAYAQMKVSEACEIADTRFLRILRHCKRALAADYNAREKKARIYALIEEGYQEIKQLEEKSGYGHATVLRILTAFERQQKIAYNIRPASEKGGRPIKVIILL